MPRTILLSGSALALALTGTAVAQHRAAFPSEPPSHAEAGQCYSRVHHDAQYNTIRETVVVADGYESYEIWVNGRRVDSHVVEPVLETRSQQYVSREAAMRYRVTEPVYETVTERVQVQPAYSRYEIEPARHETVSERVLVREARLVWRRGYVEGARSYRHDPETGEVWCLIEEPAEYRTITRSIVAEPAQVREVPVEARYQTIERVVLRHPATVEEVPIPAQHASYEYRTVLHPAEVRARYVEERTDVLERYELVAPERYEWQRVECAEIDFGRHGQEGYQSSSAPASAGHGHEGTPVAALSGGGHDATLHPGAPQRWRPAREN